MTFRKFLTNQGLAPSTIDLYCRVDRTIPVKKDIEWLRHQISLRQPISTLMIKRAVIKFRKLMDGYSEEEIKIMLPKCKGFKSQMRSGLTLRQVKRYNFVVQGVPEPFSTILLLLPLTGLRINELCTLQTKNLRRVGDRLMLELIGKGGKPRKLPLSKQAEKVLMRFMRIYTPEKWLFRGRKDFIKPSSVRNWTLKIQRENPELENLSPDVLHHTFATMLHKKNVSPLTIQMLLGHSDLRTTQRYIHPTIDDLIDGIDRL